MKGFTEEHLSNAQFGRNKAWFSIGETGDKSVTSNVKVFKRRHQQNVNKMERNKAVAYRTSPRRRKQFYLHD